MPDQSAARPLADVVTELECIDSLCTVLESGSTTIVA
jgi:hypothetical protein